VWAACPTSDGRQKCIGIVEVREIVHLAAHAEKRKEAIYPLKGRGSENTRRKRKRVPVRWHSQGVLVVSDVSRGVGEHQTTDSSKTIINVSRRRGKKNRNTRDEEKQWDGEGNKTEKTHRTESGGRETNNRR